MNTPTAPVKRVKVDLGEGVTAFVEVADVRGEVATGSTLPFDQVLATVRAISNGLNDTLRQVRPNKASITYGLLISNKAPHALAAPPPSL